jgi:hypothetical protein
MRRLQPAVGQWVRVALGRYHVASWRGGARRLALWEVAHVDGLADQLHYAHQRDVYHVTDTAACVGCAPRDARGILDGMRTGTLHADWAVETMAPPGDRRGCAEISACVRNV